MTEFIFYNRTFFSIPKETGFCNEKKRKRTEREIRGE